VTGGQDKNVVVFNRSEKKVAQKLTGHSKRVLDVQFHPTQDVIFSSSADKTARVWSSKGDSAYSSSHIVKSHTDEVSGVTVHPTGSYWVTGSLDATWALHDLQTSECLNTVQNVSGIHSISFHPDGLILGTGLTDSKVQIWDIKALKNVATFEGHKDSVLSLSFSENGYYLATGSKDNTVKLWDLRKLKNFHEISLPDGFGVSSVEWDYSGSYLAVAGSDIRLYVGKTLNHAVTLAGHSKEVTDVKWGKNASFLVSTSLDKHLTYWGKEGKGK